ncbi:hypothetical protein BDZ89DRAFT_1055614 [Hymenopellis radicata]|nr:hypothetical protein BDZ89DRAFT_1055614 [Hymenopellis radicata]
MVLAIALLEGLSMTASFVQGTPIVSIDASYQPSDITCVGLGLVTWFSVHTIHACTSCHDCVESAKPAEMTVGNHYAGDISFPERIFFGASV